MARIDFREFIKDTPKTNFYWLVNVEHYKMWLAKKQKTKRKKKERLALSWCLKDSLCE